MLPKLKFHEITGYLGAFLYSVMLIPQLIKTVHTKSTEDLSVYFILMFLLAAICMTHYAIKTKSRIIVFNNFFNIIINIIMLYLYFLYYDYGEGHAMSLRGGDGKEKEEPENSAPSPMI